MYAEKVKRTQKAMALSPARFNWSSKPSQMHLTTFSRPQFWFSWAPPSLYFRAINWSGKDWSSAKKLLLFQELFS